MTGKFALSLVLAGILISCGGNKNPPPENASTAEPAADSSSSSTEGAAPSGESAADPAAESSSPESAAPAEPAAADASANAEPVPADPGAPPPSDDLQSYVGGGAYTPEYRTVTENMGVIKQCYLDALRSSPDIQGVLKVKFTVNKAGKATKATALQNELNDQVEKCVLAEIKKLKFPKRSDNRTVEYPFKFMPAP